MTTFSTLAKSFNPGFRPDLQSNQINAAKAKKSCCCWNNKELEKELTASNNALNWVQANHGAGATDAEIKSIFQNVSGRKRYYQRITSGFWGWLRSLFRCRTTNRQLKNLATTLSSIQKVVVHSQSFQHSVFTQLQSGGAKQDLFKQLEKEFPQLIISKTPKASDFGLSKKQTTPNVPFLLHKTKNQIEVALAPASPTAAPVIKKVANLKELPQVFSESIESRFTQLRDKKGCYESELNYNSATNPPPANKIHLNLEKEPVEGKCTLVAQIEHVLYGRQTHRYDLTLESTPEKAQEWIDGLVKENKSQLSRIEQLHFDNMDFKVDWQTRRFTTEVTVGGHQENFISDDLSTEAFNRVKAAKETFVQNKGYFDSLPDVFGEKQLKLGKKLFITVKDRANAGYKLILTGLYDDPIKKMVAKNENLERAVDQLKEEYALDAVIRNRTYFKKLNPFGNPKIAEIDLKPNHEAIITITSIEKGYEIRLDHTYDVGDSLGTFALSDNIEEIVKLVKQNPAEILENFEGLKQGDTAGDYTLQFTLIHQTNSLPLLRASIFNSSKAEDHFIAECRIDLPFDPQSIRDKTPTIVPNDYLACKNLLCTQAEMDEAGSNQTPVSEQFACGKVALSVNKEGDAWHYKARIYDVETQTVKTHETSRPVIDDPNAQTIQDWVYGLLKKNKDSYV